MTETKILSVILSQLATCVERLTESEIRKIESEEYSLELKISKKSPRQQKKKIFDQNEYEEIYNILKDIKNRETGRKIIDENLKTRKNLEDFAKHIHVYITKQDNSEKIKEKIIEGTIGASLRSNAIQKSQN